MTARARLSRRGFLAGALASAGAAGAVAACDSPSSERSASARSGDPADRLPAPAFVEFHGPHQAGITAHPPASGLLAAFNAVAADRAELAETFRALTDEARHMMSGRPYPALDPGLPPAHTGALGEAAPAADLSVVVSVGASLFDGRYGLAARRPRDLVEMPFLANDRLDPERSHGDLLFQISGDSPDVTLFALRQLMRRTRDTLVLKWMVEGFNRRDAPRPGRAPVRNLMGFKDGTANLAADQPEVTDRYVWVADADGEPGWAVGGSYHVVRVIRMFVEFWDRASLREQESIIGRHKDTGAPLGMRDETDVPDYADDPEGERIPLDAHIRLANPRTPETADSLILRRGFSFSRGYDSIGRLDQGLAFVSYQRRMRQFLETQARLAGEPLEEYVLPVGGGFFFALPGVRDETDWYASALLA